MKWRLWWIKYNKSEEKSISNIYKNKNNSETPGKQQINKEKYMSDNHIQMIGQSKSENKITINTYINTICLQLY